VSEPSEPQPSAARAAGFGDGCAGARVRPGTPSAGHLFAYGTLEVPAVLAKVTGRMHVARAALLSGFSRYLLARYPYPAMIADPAGSIAGSVFLDLDAAAFARLDAYEGDLYERCQLSVTVGDALLQAQSYVLRGEFHELLSAAPWDRHEFERRHLESYLARL
jgi:gamma-glutamylcyclotransferase (GGCT)/AIG2-like uncharacterized protein YtfP